MMYSQYLEVLIPHLLRWAGFSKGETRKIRGEVGRYSIWKPDSEIRNQFKCCWLK
jgi:hypothetical protein